MNCISIIFVFLIFWISSGFYQFSESPCSGDYSISCGEYLNTKVCCKHCCLDEELDLPFGRCGLESECEELTDADLLYTLSPSCGTDEEECGLDDLSAVCCKYCCVNSEYSLNMKCGSDSYCNTPKFDTDLLLLIEEEEVDDDDEDRSTLHYIILGCLLLFVAIIVIALYCILKKKRNRKKVHSVCPTRCFNSETVRDTRIEEPEFQKERSKTERPKKTKKGKKQKKKANVHKKNSIDEEQKKNHHKKKESKEHHKRKSNKIKLKKESYTNPEENSPKKSPDIISYSNKKIEYI